MKSAAAHALHAPAALPDDGGAADKVGAIWEGMAEADQPVSYLADDPEAPASMVVFVQGRGACAAVRRALEALGL